MVWIYPGHLSRSLFLLIYLPYASGSLLEKHLYI